MSEAGKLSLENRLEVQELLFRFMRSFDDKDWEKMRNCLAQNVECDYSSFRGTPPATISRDDYVALRRSALAALRTQHNLSNISIEDSADGAEARCNYAILRFHPDFDGAREKFFHSYGQYRFGVVRSGDGWRVASIKQILLMNDGNPDLHAGMRK